MYDFLAGIWFLHKHTLGRRKYTTSLSRKPQNLIITDRQWLHHLHSPSFLGGKVNSVNSWQAGVWHDDVALPFVFMFFFFFVLLVFLLKKRSSSSSFVFCYRFAFVAVVLSLCSHVSANIHAVDGSRLILTHWLWQLVRGRGVWRRHQEVLALLLVSTSEWCDPLTPQSHLLLFFLLCFSSSFSFNSICHCYCASEEVAILQIARLLFLNTYI